MADIRIGVENSFPSYAESKIQSKIHLIVNNKRCGSWTASFNAGEELTKHRELVRYMLLEAYEQGKHDQKGEISKTLRGIFGLKE